MTVLVSGATSQIGRYLLARLSQSGVPVVAISRRAQPPMVGVQWRVGDLESVLAGCSGERWQAIISFSPMGAWSHWLAGQTEAPAPRIIATSSMSVVTKQDSSQPDEQHVVAQLQAGEQGLAMQAARLGMHCTLFRPTLIYGAGIDRSLTPIVSRARRLRLFPIPMAHGMRQPVHADDIAQAVLAALASDAAAGRVLEIGGGERLDYLRMFQRVHASLGGGTLPLYLPGWALRLLAAAVPRARGPVSRLQQDLVADNSALVALLGIQPRPFQPDASTWRPMTPEQAQLRVGSGARG
ncbi:NAD-dependent epimerase/dehydratase family protein [Stenotrophomonas sp.]|uniref:NAD-dependent epimerase/dehydratase family protein n=1 Tax=Stenotrophomonas sp. TaxID=69392 RepID=UPI00289EFC64|nr:NAD-dependent epimerase/dehydratase family protein [Stenotrophomonas sp.]